MADSQGRTLGDPGYDVYTDPDYKDALKGTPTQPDAPTPFVNLGASPGPTTSTAPPTGGNVQDPKYAASLVHYYGSLPGADPSLLSNPSYWTQKIMSGEFGTDQAYVANKLQNSWKDSSATTGVTDPTTFGKLLQPFPGYQAPTGPPPSLDLPAYAAPTPFGSYSLPTGDQVRQTPGYQFGLDQSIQGLTNAKAAQGVARTGGTLANILDLAGNYADQHYSDYVNQDMAGYNANRETYATNEAGRLGAYTANNAAKQQVASAQRQAYMDQYGIWRNTNNDQFNYLDSLYGTGASAAGTA